MGREVIQRGDLVSVVISGDYGKPRPALVIQSDSFSRLLSVTILPLTSYLLPAPLYRIPVHPDAQNNLRQISHIMADKISTIQRSKMGHRIGRVDATTLQEAYRAVVTFLDR